MDREWQVIGPDDQQWGASLLSLDAARHWAAQLQRDWPGDDPFRVRVREVSDWTEINEAPATVSAVPAP